MSIKTFPESITRYNDLTTEVSSLISASGGGGSTDWILSP